MIPQRNPRTPRVTSVREMVPADLESLRQPSARGRLTKLRDAHHIIARCLAAGLTINETAARVGYNAARVSILRSDPAMADLIAKYRDEDTKAWLESRDEFWSASTANMLKAERMISDKLDDAIDSGETLPLRDLLSLTADRADRFGYPKKSVNTNVNVDFASHLEAARRRVEAARQIEHQTEHEKEPSA